MGVIVVGVDSSDGAKAALRFALAEAKLRQASVSAVHVWQFGFYGAAGTGAFDPAFGVDLSDVRAAAEAELEATVDAVVSSGSEVEVTRRVVEGTPGAVLVEQSRDAELLVVGSRGHGGFAGLLLGSVSQQCAQHAACPVVIIPHENRR
jgi:nucleotide-binding universal stress UspA family protein